jgi:hypothetical protein
MEIREYHEKKIEGTIYRGIITARADGVHIMINVRREMPEGGFQWAFLSNRQHKAETRAKRAFSAEIEAVRKRIA